MSKVYITPKAQKQFKHITILEQVKIKKKFTVLENNPYAGKKLSGELSELRSLKIWPYRIISYLEKDFVFVTSIIHRQGAYQ